MSTIFYITFSQNFESRKLALFVSVYEKQFQFYFALFLYTIYYHELRRKVSRTVKIM